MAFPRIEVFPRAKQPLTGDEDLLVSQDGVTRKTSVQSIADLASGGGGGEVIDFPAASAPAVSLASGTPVGVGASGKLVACRADDPSTLPCVGFYIGGASVSVRVAGIQTTSGLTAGLPYFIANTGGLTATEPTTPGYGAQRMGTALTTTQLFFQPGLVVVLD